MSVDVTKPQENPDIGQLRNQSGGAGRKVRILLWTCLVAGLVVACWLIARYGISRSYARACQQAERDKDWRRLETLATNWSAWRGNQAQPWIYLAQAAEEQGDIQRAAVVLDRCPPGDPLTPLAWLEQSTFLFGPLNKPILGAESCERAIALNPRLKEAYRRLVYFYAYTLQRRKMVRSIYDAMQHDCDLPETYLYLIAQDWLSFADAYQQNTKWLREAPDEELFLVAQTLYGIKSRAIESKRERQQTTDGRLEPRHKEFVDACFARFPKNLELLVYYLQAHSADGDLDEVARLLASVPPEAELDGRFWRYKGWLHATRGELNEAANAYRKALELNPYDPISHHQWAAVERRLNRKDHVETLEALAREGQELRRVVILLPDVTLADRDLLQRVAKYCAACGDTVAATKLERRLQATGF